MSDNTDLDFHNFEYIFKLDKDLTPNEELEYNFTVEDGTEESRDERIAIVVGAQNYDDVNIQDLNYTIDDAFEVKETLKKLGAFSVLYMLSTPDSIIPPTKENIINGLNAVSEFSREGKIKTFIFYFAGHGFYKDGKNYMIAKDTKYNDLINTGLSLDEVLSMIKDIQKYAKVMVFMDACRNSYILRDGKTFWQDEDSSGLKILYSSSKGMPSYEIPKLKHGLYTKLLLEALKGEADKHPYGINDGFVSFEETSKYVTLKMKEWNTENPLFKQLPRVEMQEAMGDFFITSNNLNME